MTWYRALRLETDLDVNPDRHDRPTTAAPEPHMRTKAHWLDKSFTRLYLACLFLCGSVFMALAPPLQAPDAPAHLLQAYTLSNLSAVPARGGMIDPALLDYLNILNTDQASQTPGKVTPERIAEMQAIRWSGSEQFVPLPVTGFYLPLLYAPQAAGLAAGRALDFSVDTSVRMARAATFGAAVLVLLYAFSLAAPVPAVLVILALPMSVFQLASVNLESMVYAVSVLSISLFANVATTQQKCGTAQLILLSVSVALLGMTKINLTPLLLLPFAAFLLCRQKRTLALGAAALVITLAWTIYVFLANSYFGSVTGMPTRDILAFYLHDPLAFLTVLANTLSDPPHLRGYSVSFIGALGWLDTIFTPAWYSLFWSLVLASFVVSLLYSVGHFHLRYRLLLLLCALGDIILIFVALLLTWTPHPATMIEGASGRYLVPPALMTAYALGAGATRWRVVDWLGRGLALAMLLTTTYGTTQLLAQRFWLPPATATTGSPTAVPQTAGPAVPAPAIAEAPPAPASQAGLMRAGPPLQRGVTQALAWPQEASASNSPVVAVGIMFGTYMRQNSGEAELRLINREGQIHSYAFSLSTLEDNAYRIFDVHPDRYVKAEIIALTGGGPSVWQLQKPTGEVLQSCVVYVLANGEQAATVGCPPPPSVYP